MEGGGGKGTEGIREWLQRNHMKETQMVKRSQNKVSLKGKKSFPISRKAKVSNERWESAGLVAPSLRRRRRRRRQRRRRRLPSLFVNYAHRDYKNGTHSKGQRTPKTFKTLTDASISHNTHKQIPK